MRHHPNDPAYMKRRPDMNETFFIPAWAYLTDTNPKEARAVKQEIEITVDETAYLHPIDATHTYNYGHTIVELHPQYDYLSPIEKAVIAGVNGYGATVKGCTVRLSTSD